MFQRFCETIETQKKQRAENSCLHLVPLFWAEDPFKKAIVTLLFPLRPSTMLYEYTWNKISEANLAKGIKSLFFWNISRTLHYLSELINTKVILLAYILINIA